MLSEMDRSFIQYSKCICHVPVLVFKSGVSSASVRLWLELQGRALSVLLTSVLWDTLVSYIYLKNIEKDFMSVCLKRQIYAYKKTTKLLKRYESTSVYMSNVVCIPNLLTNVTYVSYYRQYIYFLRQSSIADFKKHAWDSLIVRTIRILNPHIQGWNTKLAKQVTTSGPSDSEFLWVSEILGI